MGNHLIIWIDGSDKNTILPLNQACSTGTLQWLCGYIKEKPVALFNMV